MPFSAISRRASSFLERVLDPEHALDAGRAVELDTVVADDLEVVAPRVAETHAAAHRATVVEAGLLGRGAHLLLVVDHEPEVAVVVRALRAALADREELVAHLEEGHPLRVAAQLEVEQGGGRGRARPGGHRPPARRG
jgi:hypothetical protein